MVIENAVGKSRLLPLIDMIQYKPEKENTNTQESVFF